MTKLMAWVGQSKNQQAIYGVGPLRLVKEINNSWVIVKTKQGPCAFHRSWFREVKQLRSRK